MTNKKKGPYRPFFLARFFLFPKTYPPGGVFYRPKLIPWAAFFIVPKLYPTAAICLLVGGKRNDFLVGGDF